MWYDYLQDNTFIRMLYNEVPDLVQVDISSIQAINDGPTIKIGLRLPRFADKPPKKWHPSFNEVGVTLVFVNCRSLVWRGWDLDNIADIEITPNGSRYNISVKSNTIEMTFDAEFIYTSDITGFCTDR